MISPIAEVEVVEDTWWTDDELPLLWNELRRLPQVEFEGHPEYVDLTNALMQAGSFKKWVPRVRMVKELLTELLQDSEVISLRRIWVSNSTRTGRCRPLIFARSR